MTRASDTAKLLGAGATILDGTTISTADNTDQLTLISTDADENSGPRVALTRDSSSPAVNDFMGLISFNGEDSGSNVTRYAYAVAQSTNVTNGSEEGKFVIHTMVGGTERQRISIAGAETIFNEDSVDVDFRVESNSNANTFFVDGGGDRVYIGDNTSRNLFASKLQIEGDGTSGMSIHRATADSGPPYLNLSSSRGTAAGDATVVQDGDGVGTIYFSGADGTDRFSGAGYISCHIDGTPGSNDMPGSLRFATTADGSSSPTEAMRITKNQNLAIGVTSEFARLHVASLGTSATPAMFEDTTTGTSSVTAVVLKRNGSNVGAINTTNNATAYVTSSDYRLKENVGYTFDATTRLKQLKPCRFNFITDADNTVDGFLAHEVSSIVPEAITGEKDETEDITNVVLNADGTIFSTNVSKERWTAGKLSTTDEQGNTLDPIYASDTTWVASKTVPNYQGIDQSKLVPLLVKTIQELEARITTLENA